MRKSDIFVALCIAILIIYWILALLLGNIDSPLISLYNWIYDVSLLLGYPGTVIVSFFGNATILFPFPYVGLPFVLGGLRNSSSGEFLFDPWIIGILSGLGAMIGEMSGFYIGMGGGHFIEDEKMNGFRLFVEQYPRATPLVIWFLAATPIPDDVLIVPLGAARYPWWKVFFPGFFGKTVLLTLIAWAGRIGLDLIASFVIGSGSGSMISFSIEIFGLVILILIFYFLIRIDWKNVRIDSQMEKS